MLKMFRKGKEKGENMSQGLDNKKTTGRSTKEDLVGR
jgi:hypothetical protein